VCHSALSHYLQEPFTDFGSGMEDQTEVRVMGVCDKRFGMSCAEQLELTYIVIPSSGQNQRLTCKKHWNILNGVAKSIPAYCRPASLGSHTLWDGSSQRC